MVYIYPTVKVLLAVLLLCCVAVVRSQTICSTFCGTNGCVGWEMSDCDGKCYSGWVWDANDGLCYPDINARQQLMAYSDDAGG